MPYVYILFVVEEDFMQVWFQTGTIVVWFSDRETKGGHLRTQNCSKQFWGLLATASLKTWSSQISKFQNVYESSNEEDGVG